MRENRIRLDPAVAADLHALVDDHAGLNDRALSNRYVLADADGISNGHTVNRVSLTRRLAGTGLFDHQCQCPRKPKARVIADHHRTICGNSPGKALRGDDNGT